MRRFNTEYSARDQCYALGTESPTKQFYLAIPVSTASVEYNEYYTLSEGEYRHFMDSREAAITFADECRIREHDDRLIIKPGSNRGAPIWPIRPTRGGAVKNHINAAEGHSYTSNTSSVSIVRTGPKSNTPQITDAALLTIGLVAGLILYLMSVEWWYLVVLIVLGLGILQGISLIRARSAIGEPLITVGSPGIQSKDFLLPWDRVVAMEFTFTKTEYLRNDPTKTKATDRAVNSLVVTSKDRDDNGRPLQYGTTLRGNYSDNYNEFRDAAQHFSPRIQFRTEIVSADYAVHTGQVEKLLEELKQSGQIVIRDRRSRPTGVALSADGFTNEGSTIRWTDASAVIAYTYVHTTQTSLGDATSRKPRLSILQTKQDSSGKLIPFRFGFLGFDYVSYGSDWLPTIEELAVVVERVAPHIRFVDQRTSG
ncbi:hypothetical protein GOEFS_064_00160 [Gordonia effusa NBRC 100432]|uniref:Uncharacterized protein n=1 Tax=Gordonia effusa NBRC 100432 TaxID=1077974 RepID=H0R126_9ACTN|nr:hypothetical protein [Gordonia effusa]GAB18777.1 hypothetical protein GOEFS_064_00160 [Gordonia effusa NBRC 100432]